MVYFHLFWVDEVGAFLWALRECGDPVVVSIFGGKCESEGGKVYQSEETRCHHARLCTSTSMASYPERFLSSCF